ncbi:MAG: phosphodiester glycosidase family protein [Bacteroidota bacterium]
MKKTEKRSLKFFLTVVFLFINYFYVVSQQIHQESDYVKDTIHVIEIKTDTLYNSKQEIYMITISYESLKSYTLSIGHSEPELIKTSTIGERYNALIAINGSFFDEDKGGSVSYFEINDSVISYTKPTSMKWAKPDSLTNGAIVLNKDNKLEIEPAKSDTFYKESKLETAVMVTGPLLIYNSRAQILPNMSFTALRHPRTCLCDTKHSVIFIAIDGRSVNAEGMSLFEVQKFLLSLGCVDAINLDGGGSTTIWTKEKGVVNLPSDKTGERSVANALIILKK